MNTFKRILIAIALVAGMLFVATAPAEAHNSRPRVCVKQWKTPYSAKARHCRKHGWFIEGGRYPISTETTPWTYARYGLVIGPRGRVWVDTLGQLGNVR